MEEKIVKNGTKVILFALDTEDTSVTGVITGHWSTIAGQHSLNPYCSGQWSRTSITQMLTAPR